MDIDTTQSCSSLKRKISEQEGIELSEYREFEYYTRGIELEYVIGLIFKNRQNAGERLEDDKILSDYNVEDKSTVHLVNNFGHRDCDIKTTCIANNLKFTTFIDYNQNKRYSVGEFKAKLAQLTGLLCSKLYLKKRGINELYELSNDAAELPLKDIYAELDGNITIEPKKSNLHFYADGDGNVVSSKILRWYV